MVRVYVDVAVPNSWKARKRGKKHVCYDPQTRRVFKVNNLAELHGYDEVYVDSLSRIHEEVLELLRRGIRVFQLNSPQLIKRLREQNGLEKSDENDAYVLSLIPDELYKELNAKELQLMRLINSYLTIDKEVVRLKSNMESVYKDVQEHAEKLIKALERVKGEIGKRIHRLIRDDEFYKRALDYFGYQKSPLIAMLLMKVDFSRGTHKILDYLGLHARAEGHNRIVRVILSKIATNIYIMALNPRRSSVPMKYIEIARRYPMRKALLKIQTEIIKDLRKIWLSQRGVLVAQ